MLAIEEALEEIHRLRVERDGLQKRLGAEREKRHSLIRKMNAIEKIVMTPNERSIS